MGTEKGNRPEQIRPRRSLFGPILLISIGLVFLGRNLGIIPGEGWNTIWRLWPLLLIIGGLDDLFRREGVAWPILMIGVGVVLLSHYFGPRSLVSWSQILQLWPVLLIAVGIDVLFRGETGWTQLLGVVLSIVLIGAAVLLAFQGVDFQTDQRQIQEGISTEITEAELDFSLSVGEFILGSDSRRGSLVDGTITPDDALDDREERNGEVSYQLHSARPAFFPSTARWELGVTSAIAVDLVVNTSVGEMLLDLDNLDLIALESSQGVGRMVVDLPETITEEVLLKQGIGILEVEIPQDVSIIVDAQNGLTRVDFPRDFELEDGYYATPGASKNNAALVIVVEQGIGLVTFRYGE
jgi:hypothetical protein